LSEADNDWAGAPLDDDQGQPNSLWRQEPVTTAQRSYHRYLNVSQPPGTNRGQASDLIDQAVQQRLSETTEAAPRPGRRAVPNSMPVDRLTRLEQAITNLTQALTDPAANQTRAAAAPGQPDETINGPIPEWLRATGENAAPSGEALSDLGGRQSGRPPDPAPDGRLDQFQGEGHRPAQQRLEDTGQKMAVSPTGTVRLEPYQDSRRQAIDDTLARLEDPQSPTGQAAFKTVRLYAGAANSDLIQQAISQHSATAVQEATAATADLVTSYRAQGLDDAAVLAAFQSGEAADAIRENLAAQELEAPLSDEQLAAVADMVLLPQRRFTREELATVIGQEVAAGAGSEQAVVDAIGSPVGFGGQTGNVRGVMAGARAMSLSPAEMSRLAALIQDGLRETVQAELAGRGYRPEVVQDFVSDLAALPGAVVVPQTTASRPPAGSSQDK
jgi:hypothetical protein